VYKLENIESVADDLHVLKYVHREGTFVGITVVLGRRKIGLVDTGFEATIVDHLFPFLREKGRNPEEIDFVVNTHRDGDHVQGNQSIKAQTKAKIAIHELDAEAVDPVDVKLKNGDTVELGDRTFEVIHTPGHTPGSICLYQLAKKLLIVGDSLVGDRVNLIRMDTNVYLTSLNRLLDLDVRLLIQSHPRVPFTKAILTEDEPREAILANITLAETSE
jgi:glyoxylase-like metal-dependent hydrolase (beta-lactamase superfamily II)